MRPPAFWSADASGGTLIPTLLSPLQVITRQATARRLRRPGWRSPVVVVCCGNAGVGGAGKTTVALDLLDGLRTRGTAVHVLTRGYGGRGGRAPLRVDPARHSADLTGDEPLLLATRATCWVCADRAEGARAALEDGADLLLMDDGLQNPDLLQDWPILVIDGEAGFGNNRLLPAGPLREPVAVAAARARCAVMIGQDRWGASRLLPPSLPLLRADLLMDPMPAELQERPLLAFCGIARPNKFFAALRELDLHLADARSFPDHHRYRTCELARLERDAAAQGARLVTTPKDAVRLPPSFRTRVHAAGVSLRWRDPAARERLLDQIVGGGSG